MQDVQRRIDLPKPTGQGDVQELFDDVRQGKEVLRVRDDRGPHVPGLHGGAVPEPSVSCVDHMQKLPEGMETGRIREE